MKKQEDLWDQPAQTKVWMHHFETKIIHYSVNWLNVSLHFLLCFTSSGIIGNVCQSISNVYLALNVSPPVWAGFKLAVWNRKDVGGFACSSSCSTFCICWLFHSLQCTIREGKVGQEIGIFLLGLNGFRLSTRYLEDDFGGLFLSWMAFVDDLRVLFLIWSRKVHASSRWSPRTPTSHLRTQL